jgi:hypothetical protein
MTLIFYDVLAIMGKEKKKKEEKEKAVMSFSVTRRRQKHVRM